MNNLRTYITHHIAGLPVAFKVNNRLIQRCAICGHKLLDTTISNLYFKEDGSLADGAAYPQGDFIRVTETEPFGVVGVKSETREISLQMLAEFPDTICIFLVE